MDYIKYSLLIALFLINIGYAQKSENQVKKDTLSVKAHEVIITAMRYPEQILEIPMAISVLEKEWLDFRKGIGADEVLNRVPGVLAQSRYGNTDVRLTIRGYGARGAGDRSNAGTSRGIKIFIDGIPETEPDGRTALDNFDLTTAEKLEIIRSNASAIWGNAAGGVVNMSTMPTLAGSYVNLNAIMGSYGYSKYMMNFGTAMENGRIWGSAGTARYDGWRDNSNGQKDYFNLGLNSAIGVNTLLGVYINGVSNRYNIPGPLTRKQYDSMPTLANPTYESRKERRYNRLARIGVTLDHSFDQDDKISSMLFINPKYLQRSERGTFRDFTRYHLGGNFNYAKSFDISKGIRNTALVGVDESFQDGAILFYNLTAQSTRSDTLAQNKSEGANSFGAFFQDELIFDEDFTFLLGLRYDNVTYYSKNFMEMNASQDRSFERLTPKFGITWRLGTDQSVYFNVGGGVEVPAGNETDPEPGQDTIYLLNPLLEPIVSTTYELGTKHYISFDGFLRSVYYDFAGYYIKTVNDIIPYSGGKFYFSAGETKRLGLELGLGIELNDGLSFNSAWTYSINEYVDYKIDSVHYNKPGSFADLKGNSIAGLPQFYYNASLKYTLKSLNGLFIELNTQGVGSYFSDDANKYEVPSFNLLNMTLGNSQPLRIIDKLGAYVFISMNNLLDTKYAASAFINPDIDKKSKLPMYLEPGLPRNVTAGFKLAWE